MATREFPVLRDLLRMQVLVRRGLLLACRRSLLYVNLRIGGVIRVGQLMIHRWDVYINKFPVGTKKKKKKITHVYKCLYKEERSMNESLVLRKMYMSYLIIRRHRSVTILAFFTISLCGSLNCSAFVARYLTSNCADVILL